MGSGPKERLRSSTTNKKRQTHQARSSISQASSRSASVVSIAEPTTLPSTHTYKYLPLNPPRNRRAQNGMSTGTQGPARARNDPYHLVRYRDIAMTPRRTSNTRLFDLELNVPSPFAVSKITDVNANTKWKSNQSPLPAIQKTDMNSNYVNPSSFSSHLFDAKTHHVNSPQQDSTEAFNGPSFTTTFTPTFTSAKGLIGPAGHFTKMSPSLPVKTRPQDHSDGYKALTPPSPTATHQDSALPLIDYQSSAPSSPAAPSPFVFHPDLADLVEMAPHKSGHSAAPARQYPQRNVPSASNGSRHNARSGPWQTWDLFDVYLKHLPPDVRTVDIWRCFRNDGHIDSIEIFVDRAGVREGTGRVTFK